MADQEAAAAVAINHNSQNGENELAQKAASLGVPYLSKAPETISPSIINIISRDVAQKHQMIAFEKSDSALKVAMIDPQNINALNALRFIAEKENLEIQIYLVSDSIFSQLFDFYIGSEEMIKEAVRSLKTEGIVFDEEESKIRQKKKEEEILLNLFSL